MSYVCGGANVAPVAGFTSTGTILVLFILLVIVIRCFFFC
ncbi:sporulation protein YjcZ [Paenibacillus alkalitolerans]|nr:sporulation protein YjcZ [Paenibacillus alkalitolerans]